MVTGKRISSLTVAGPNTGPRTPALGGDVRYRRGGFAGPADSSGRGFRAQREHAACGKPLYLISAAASPYHGGVADGGRLSQVTAAGPGFARGALTASHAPASRLLAPSRWERLHAPISSAVTFEAVTRIDDSRRHLIEGGTLATTETPRLPKSRSPPVGGRCPLSQARSRPAVERFAATVRGPPWSSRR